MSEADVDAPTGFDAEHAPAPDVAPALALDAAVLRSRFAELDLTAEAGAAGELRVSLPGAQAIQLLRGLHADPGPARCRLVDLTAVDRGNAVDPRFEVVYRLRVDAPEEAANGAVEEAVEETVEETVEGEASGAIVATSLRVHAGVGWNGSEREPSPGVESVVSLWPAARWLECEVRELFGIAFAGHAEPSRLLLDPGLEGFPLRKDASGHEAPGAEDAR